MPHSNFIVTAYEFSVHLGVMVLGALHACDY